MTMNSALQKKKVWVTAAGTGSAFHICTIAKEHFADEIELFVSDINEPFMVAASALADHFFKVPPVKDAGYKDLMYKLLKENEIDLIIPLIPWEQPLFAKDNQEFAELNIATLAPDTATDERLNDKESLAVFCQEMGIPTIRIYSCDEWKKGLIPEDSQVFLKAKAGFGSMGARKLWAKELTEADFKDCVVQEFCGTESGTDEITVEVFNGSGKLYSIARRRLESKSGVCTKAEIVDAPELEAVIKKLVDTLSLPVVFNVQFVQHENQWKLMDCNLRLAAGTGLSHAAGFQLIRGMFASFLGQNVEDSWFETEKGIRTILRVYREIVIRE